VKQAMTATIIQQEALKTHTIQTIMSATADCANTSAVKMITSVSLLQDLNMVAGKWILSP
jgi:hypothetical protein